MYIRYRNRKGIIERFSGRKEEKKNAAEGSSGSFLGALSDDTRGQMSTSHGEPGIRLNFRTWFVNKFAHKWIAAPLG